MAAGARSRRTVSQALQGQTSMAVTAKNMEGRLARARQIRAIAAMAFDAVPGARVIEKVMMALRAIDGCVFVVGKADLYGGRRRGRLQQEPARGRGGYQ